MISLRKKHLWENFASINFSEVQNMQMTILDKHFSMSGTTFFRVVSFEIIIINSISLTNFFCFLGIFGVPLEIVFQVMYESVLEFSWKYSNRGILKTIQYVNNDEEIYQEMCAFFEKSHQSNPLGVTGVSAERRGLFLKPERESPIVMGESLEAIGESSQAINQQKGEFPKEKENSSKVQRESSKEKANKSENKNEISQVVDKIKEGMAKPVNAIVKVHRSCAKRRKSGRKGGPPASDRSRGEGAMEESAHRRDHTNTREDASEEMEVDEDSMVTQSEKETLENTEDDTMEGASHDTGKS